MTLPIIDSILRGELRPNILVQVLGPNEMEQLIRNARRISKKSQLMELEFAINDVLCNLVETEDIYAEERKTRNAAIQAIKNNVFKGDIQNKYLSSEVVIDGVLSLPELKSPLLRFYNTILDAEVLRTRQAILYLYNSVQDNIFMRSTLRAFFRKIKFTCREALQWEEHQDVMSLIPVKLTHLYFTLLNTYAEVLNSYETPEYEDDFMDFVYGWKCEYPTSDEKAKYIEQSKNKTAIDTTIVDFQNATKVQENPRDEKPLAKDKADTFLEGVEEYNFLEIPMIKQLGSNKKVHDLVMTMLDKPGHACAMLEHIRFYDWIKNTQRIRFTLSDYEILCSKVVMGKEKSSAFHTVRMSLNQNNQNSNKYRAYAYINQVADEYKRLLNS